MYQVDADEYSASRFFGNQVLVFHFLDMAHAVKGGVPNQKPERVTCKNRNRGWKQLIT
jgi:hypothetical protein